MSRWFRFYTSVLDNPKTQMLAPDLFKNWVNVLCIAAQHDGELPAIGVTAFMLGRITEPKAAEILSKLAAAGLLDRTEKSFRPHNWDSRQYKHDKTDNTNAERQQRHRNNKRNGVNNGSDNANSNGVTTVTAKRPDSTEIQNTESDSEANASGADAPPDPSEPERQFFARGKERGALGPSSGGQLAKLLKTCGGNVALARSKLELAITKEKPGEFIAGILRAGIQVHTGKPLTQHQIERQTTRDILDELDSFDSRSGQADPGLLRHDSGGRSAGVHGGVRRDVVQISASSRRAGD